MCVLSGCPLLGLLHAQCCPQGQQPPAPALCNTHTCSGRSGVSPWPQQLLPWLQVRRVPAGTGWSAAGSRGPPAAPLSHAQPCKETDTVRLCPCVPTSPGMVLTLPQHHAAGLLCRSCAQGKCSMVGDPSPQEPPAHIKAAEGHSSSSPSSTTIPLGVCCRALDQCAALAFAEVAPQARVLACTLGAAGWPKQPAPALQGEGTALALRSSPGLERICTSGTAHGVPMACQCPGREEGESGCGSSGLMHQQGWPGQRKGTVWHPEPPALFRHCLHRAPALCPIHSPVATSSKGTAGHSSLHLCRWLSRAGEQGVNSPSAPSSHSGQMSFLLP